MGPSEETECIVLYADCDFKGMSTRICDDTPFVDFDYEVHSITVPLGKTIYLYNLPCFQGLNAEFTNDVPCIDYEMDGLNFSFLELHNIKLYEESTVIGKEGTFHAKYRRPNLRKAGTLKSYERV